MNKTPSLKVQEQWQRVVNAYERSGLAVDVFCAKRGICSTSFYARRKQLRLMEKNKERSGFIKLTTAPVSQGSKSILPMRGYVPRYEAMPVRIQTPNGYSVEALVAGAPGLADILGVLKSV